MKKILVTLLAFLCFTAVEAQKSMFDKYGDMEGVTTVFISKTMLKMMPDMDMQGMDIGTVASRLTGVRIFTTERRDIALKMKADVNLYLKNNQFEELMRIRDGDENVLFIIRPRPDGRIAELAMFVEEPGEYVIIQLTGDLSLEDIQKLTKGMK